MRTWILFSAFWLAETINPVMEYNEVVSGWAVVLFLVGMVLDIADFSRNK